MNRKKSKKIFRSGVRYFNQKRFDRAQECFKESICSEIQNPEAYYYLGIIEEKKQNFEKAVVFLREAIEIAPDNTDIQSALGRVYYLLGRLEQSKMCFKKTIEMRAEKKVLEYAFAMLGFIFKRQGLEKASILCLEKAVELDSKNSLVYSELAELHLCKKSAAEAVLLSEKSLKFDENNITACRIAGEGSLYLNRTEEAVNYLKKAVKLDKENIYLKGLLDSAVAENSKLNEEISLCHEITEEDFSNEACYWFLAYLYGLKGDREAEIEAYVRIADICPGETEVFKILGGYYFENRLYNKAMACFEKIILREPDNFKAYLDLGICRLRSNYIYSAVSFLEKAAQINGENSEALYYLGKAYFKTGRQEKADEVWRKLIEVNPKDDIIREKIKQIQKRAADEL